MKIAALKTVAAGLGSSNADQGGEGDGKGGGSNQ
jgi:hypothetical protein